MKCPECGYALPNNSKFCQYCGSKIFAENENIAAPEMPTSKLPDSADMLQPTQESSKASDEKNTSQTQQESESACIPDVPANHYSELTPDAGGLTDAPNEAPAHNKKKKICRFCGGLIDAKTKKCASCGKQSFRSLKRTVGVIALAIVFAVLVGLNVYQYVIYDSNISDMEQQIEESVTTISDLEQQIGIKDSLISSQKSTIATQNSQIVELDEKAEYYDEICDFLSGDDAGYASNNFKASESIIVLSLSDSRKSFTLTSDLNTDATISLQTSGLAASIDFAESTWRGSTTTMYVSPNSEGVSIATFANSVNSQAFRVLVIVTD